MAHRYYASQKYANAQASNLAGREGRTQARQEGSTPAKAVKSLMARLRRTHWLLSLDFQVSPGGHDLDVDLLAEGGEPFEVVRVDEGPGE